MSSGAEEVALEHEMDTIHPGGATLDTAIVDALFGETTRSAH